MELLGGRKFVFAILLTALFASFVYLGQMTVAEFKDTCIWIYGLFAAANAAPKMVKRVKQV